MREANLTKANLTKANLTKANLTKANLTRANLTRANLTKANLFKANLFKANLSKANLVEANLFKANLVEANLFKANLSWADLTGADLNGVILTNAILTNAILTNTILDPKAPVPSCTDEQLISANLIPKTIKGVERVYGFRTKQSLYVGNTTYTPGWHRANALSLDQGSDCHPGIYLGGTSISNRKDLVQAWCYRHECVFISLDKGVRARRIWVLKG